MAEIIPRIRPEVTPVADIPSFRENVRVPDLAGNYRQVGESLREGVNVFAEAQQAAEARRDAAQYMEAQAKLSDWRNRWNDPNNPNGVRAFKGRDALGLVDKMLPDFDTTVNQIELSLSPRGREQFRALARTERADVVARANTYATGQLEEWEDANRSAWEVSARNELADAVVSGDQQRAADLHQRIEETMQADGMLRGRPAAETQLRVLKAKSDAHELVVDRLLIDNPVQAKQYMEQHAGELLPAVRNALSARLYPLLRDAQGYDDAVSAIAGGPVFDDATVPPPRGEPAPEVSAAIEAAAKKHGVPAEYLYALAEQESGFNPRAVNPERLDDGDHAVGLYQYRASTSKRLGGFDRFDMAASADAAAKEFADRMRRHGPDFAIAGHFAGDGGADAVVNRGRTRENPKTTHYVGEVKARVRRWTQAEPQAPVQFNGPAVTQEEALERLRALGPRRYQAAASQVRQIFEARKAERQRWEQETSEAIYGKVTQADPRKPLWSLLSPQEIAFVGQDEKLSASIHRFRELIAGGQVIKDDPATLDALYRLKFRDPSAFNAENLTRYADRLSGKTLSDLRQQQTAARQGKTPQFATEEQLLAIEFEKLGIVDDPSTKKQDETAIARGKYRAAWLLLKENFIATTGKEPDDKATQQLLRSLTRGQAGDRLFERMQSLTHDIPPDKREDIVASYRRRYGVAPTELDIQSIYWRWKRGQ